MWCGEGSRTGCHPGTFTENLDNRIYIHQVRSSVDAKASAAGRCAMTPEGRAGNIIPKCRMVTGRAMKHGRDHDTSVRAWGQETCQHAGGPARTAGRLEPYGAGNPLPPDDIPLSSGVIVDKYRTNILEERAAGHEPAVVT